MKIIIATLISLLLVTTGYSQNESGFTGSKISQQDAEAALNFHNKVRSDVGAPPLEWSPALSAYAQEWANKLARNCKIQHRPIGGKDGRKFGENIFWGGGKEFTALEASEAWYSEIKQYHYAPIDQSKWQPTGHYTQMVWSGTTKVGIGIAKCRGGQTIIVANYDPPGNFMGMKPY